MENPLELPAPEDPIQRVHELARDLAYGAIRNYWSAKIAVTFEAANERWIEARNVENPDKKLEKYLREKWDDKYPSRDLMLSFGYFSFYGEIQGISITFLITQKAYSLLETHIAPPKIFISYAHKYSSTLAL